MQLRVRARFLKPPSFPISSFQSSASVHDAGQPFGATMKLITTLIAATFSVLLAGQSHAQSTWGTQDTSFSWIGFDWKDVGLGGYSTGTDGWGVVGQGLDLGNLDPTLAGLTVSVNVSQTDDTPNSSWAASNGTTLSTARLGGVQLEFEFSQPVAFRRTPISAVAFGPGEIETYGSDSLDYMEVVGGGLNLVGGVSIDAIAPATVGVYDIYAEDYSTQYFSVTWDDDVGVALTQALHFEISAPTAAVPEPSSLFIAGSLVGGLFLRRRRKIQL